MSLTKQPAKANELILHALDVRDHRAPRSCVPQKGRVRACSSKVLRACRHVPSLPTYFMLSFASTMIRGRSYPARKIPSENALSELNLITVLEDAVDVRGGRSRSLRLHASNADHDLHGDLAQA